MVGRVIDNRGGHRGQMGAATVLALFLVANLAYLLVFDLAARSWNHWDVISGFIGLNIACLAIAAIVLADRLNPATVFLVSWYGCLSLSRFRLASIQVDFGASEMLFLVGLPFTFVLAFQLPQHLSWPRLRLPRVLTYEHVQLTSFAVYLLLSVLIQRTRGSLILNPDIGAAKATYALPFVSMLHEFLAYFMLALMTRQRARVNVAIIIAVLLTTVLVHYSRGNFFRVVAFGVFLALVRRQVPMWTVMKRGMMRGALGLTLFPFIFALMGEIRYRAREFDIIAYTGMRVSNLVVAWLNTYFCTPYDLAAMALRAGQPMMIPLLFVQPILSTAQMDGLYRVHTEVFQPVAVRGINSVGGLASFIRDWGQWYVFEWWLYAAIVGLLWHLARRGGQLGVQALLLAFTAFAFFDTSLLKAQVIFGIVAGLLVGAHVITSGDEAPVRRGTGG